MFSNSFVVRMFVSEATEAAQYALLWRYTGGEMTFHDEFMSRLPGSDDGYVK